MDRIPCHVLHEIAMTDNTRQVHGILCQLFKPYMHWCNNHPHQKLELEQTKMHSSICDQYTWRNAFYKSLPHLWNDYFRNISFNRTIYASWIGSVLHGKTVISDHMLNLRHIFHFSYGKLNGISLHWIKDLNCTNLFVWEYGTLKRIVVRTDPIVYFESMSQLELSLIF